MIVDYAVHAPADNNGPGDPRTVIVNVSALGTFSGATTITIDKNTNAANGPVSQSIIRRRRYRLHWADTVCLKLKR